MTINHKKLIKVRGKEGILTELINKAEGADKSSIKIVYDLELRYAPINIYNSVKNDFGIAKSGKEFESYSELLKDALTLKKNLSPEKLKIKNDMIKKGVINSHYAKTLKLRISDIQNEIILRNLLIDFLLKITKQHTHFYKHLKAKAQLGHYVEFDEMSNEMKIIQTKINQFQELHQKKRNTNEDETKKNVSQQEEKYEPVNQNSDYEKELAKMRLELRDETIKSANEKSRELSKINNLCYLLFFNKMQKKRTYSEFRARLIDLSKTNLIGLLYEYRKIHNALYKKQIEESIKKKKAASYKPKKNYTPKQLSSNIKKLRRKGHTQIEVAGMLGVSERTIRNYEKNY